MYFAGFTNPSADAFIRKNFFKDFSYKGIMVEVGCGPPIYESMSKHWRNHGWRSICIDPNPKFVQQHKEDRSEIYQYACSDFEEERDFVIASTNISQDRDGVSYSALDIRYPNQVDYPYVNKNTIKVQVIKLNTLLEQLKIDKIDILCVDTEGWELDVMRGFDHKKYSPKIIVLENLLYDSAYSNYMTESGYTKISDLYPNEIYVLQ